MFVNNSLVVMSLLICKYSAYNLHMICCTRVLVVLVNYKLNKLCIMREYCHSFYARTMLSVGIVAEALVRYPSYRTI